MSKQQITKSDQTSQKTPKTAEAVKVGGDTPSFETQLELFHNPATPELQRQAIAGHIQRTMGNQYLSSLVQREVPEPTKDAEAEIVYPTTVTIAGEQIKVASAEEEEKAKQIMADIQSKYGIKVDSSSGVKAVKASYDKAPEDVRNAVSSTEWEFKELVAIANALVHFAPILGANRDSSNRKGDDQEIITVSKLFQSIDKNKASGVSDPDTLGEFFEDDKNFSMFTPGTDSTVDFADNAKQLEGTAVHEIAHGLMEYELDGYIAALDYWTDKNTESGKADAEAPITDYGGTNAAEDLSEAVMYFFVEPATLKTKCPERHALIQAMIDKWKPEAEEPAEAAPAEAAPAEGAAADAKPEDAQPIQTPGGGIFSSIASFFQGFIKSIFG